MVGFKSEMLTMNPLSFGNVHFFSLQSDNWNGGNVMKRNEDINVLPNPISKKMINDKHNVCNNNILAIFIQTTHDLFPKAQLRLKHYELILMSYLNLS